MRNEKKLDRLSEKIGGLEKEISNYKDNGMRGAIVKKGVKCGKKNCKCNSGALHGPYSHIQFYCNKELKMIYIKKEDVEKVKIMHAKNKEMMRKIKILNSLYKKRLVLIQEMESVL